jgi:DNA-binding Xre family transcriptional regulator
VWRLRQVMAEHGMFATSDLVAPLAERGIELSASQVHRLVAGIPERLSLPVLAALCDILDVNPAALIVTQAENMAPRRAVAGDRPAPVNPDAIRPRPARLRPDP